MATLLRAARKASLASRPAAMASCGSARAAGVAAAARLGSGVSDPLKSLRPRRMSASADDVFPTVADYPHLPDDAKYPTDKDMESDEGVWAYYARYVHDWNTYVPDDQEEEAIRLQKRREATLLLSKGEDVSDIDELHVPHALGRLADGGDPFFRECDIELLKRLDRKEREEACSAVKDVVEE